MEKTQSLLMVEAYGLSNFSTIDTGDGDDIITASGGIDNTVPLIPVMVTT
jgi:hypothetical protein